MSDGERITLEGQAVEEILKEAKRSKELAYDLGPTGWKKRDVLPNKRFLNNTLVSTLRHSYREDKKHRIGSSKKYHDHMKNRRPRGRNLYRNHGDRDKEEDIEVESDGPEPDYGEFDAIAYSDKCTDLYIRDSHRKHSFMKGSFVEKRYKGSSSESEESYTEYDDPQSNNHHHHRGRNRSKWSDTGSADEYDAGFEETRNQNDEKKHSHRKDRGESHRQKDSKDKNRMGHSSKDKSYKRKDYDRSYHDAGTSRHSEGRENARHETVEHYPSRKKLRKDKEFIPESDEVSDEDSDEECINSGTESADNNEKAVKDKGKGKKARKIPNDGKNLWEKISSRSMYADIEEIKMKKDSGVSEYRDKKENSRHTRQMKVDRDERRQRYLQKQKDEEEEVERLAELEREKEERRDEHERIRKEESMKRLADRKRKEVEMQHDAERQRNEMEMRRIADMHWQNEQMRLAAFEHFRGRFQRRPFRGRPFMRGRPFFRGRPPRGSRGGFQAFPTMNPFYASFFNEIDPYLLEKFIKEHGHKLIRKSKRHGHRSESRSRSRSRKHKKKSRRHYSDSDTSHSRDRSRSRSRRHSSRYSSSYSRSRSRSYSRHRSRDRTKSRSRRRSRNSSRSDSKRRSRERSRSSSRSRRYSSDRYSRSRSKSHSRNERSESSDSHRSSSDRSYSRSRRKHKRSGKHRKSKHRKHSKSKKKSKKSSESENEESSSNDNDSDDESNVGESEKSADDEGNIEVSEKSVENEGEYSDTHVEPEEGEVSEGEIVSDDNDGLENVSDEESGEAWSSSSDGAIE